MKPLAVPALALTLAALATGCTAQTLAVGFKDVSHVAAHRIAPDSQEVAFEAALPADGSPRAEAVMARSGSTEATLLRDGELLTWSDSSVVIGHGVFRTSCGPVAFWKRGCADVSLVPSLQVRTSKTLSETFTATTLTMAGSRTTVWTEFALQSPADNVAFLKRTVGPNRGSAGGFYWLGVSSLVIGAILAVFEFAVAGGVFLLGGAGAVGTGLWHSFGPESTTYLAGDATVEASMRAPPRVAGTWYPGDAVYVESNGNWYAAHVVRVKEDSFLVLYGLDGRTEWLPAARLAAALPKTTRASSSSSHGPPGPVGGTFTVGQRVKAEWHGSWYLARIKEARPDQYLVRWDDRVEEWCVPNRISAVAEQ